MWIDRLVQWQRRRQRRWARIEAARRARQARPPAAAHRAVKEQPAVVLLYGALAGLVLAGPLGVWAGVLGVVCLAGAAAWCWGFRRKAKMPREPRQPAAPKGPGGKDRKIAKGAYKGSSG